MRGVIWVMCAVLLLPNWAFAAAGASYIPRENLRTVSIVTYTTVATDLSRVIELTNAAGGTVTLSSHPSGWFTDVLNASASGTVTVDPAGTATINGAAGLTLPPGASCRVVSKGVNWAALCGAGVGAVTPPPPPPPTGPTYYIKTTGSDAADGKTLATAWLTLTKAANTLIAGDTVLIQDGTYVETNPVRPINNGTASLPITFKAQNKQLAILSSLSYVACGAAFNVVNSWIVIDGLVIQPEPGGAACASGTGAAANVRCWDTVGDYPTVNGSQFTLKQGCTIRNTLMTNTGSKYVLAFKTNQDYTLLEDSTLYSTECYNQNSAIFRRNIISGKDFYNSTHTCKGGARNHEFYDNVVTAPPTDNYGAVLLGGATGLGTGVYNQDVPGPTYRAECINCIAYNNVIVGSGLTNSTSGGSAIGLIGTVDSWIFNNVIIGPYILMAVSWGFNADTNSTVRNSGFRNNIFTCSSLGVLTNGYHGYQGFVNFTMDYNLFYQCNGVPAESLHTITANPQFVSPPSDLHLTYDGSGSDSPAVDAGQPMPSLNGYGGAVFNTSKDHAGTTRTLGSTGTYPAGWDLGIYVSP